MRNGNGGGSGPGLRAVGHCLRRSALAVLALSLALTVPSTPAFAAAVSAGPSTLGWLGLSRLDVTDVNGLFGPPKWTPNGLRFEATDQFQTLCVDCGNSGNIQDHLVLEIDTQHELAFGLSGIELSLSVDYQIESGSPDGFSSVFVASIVLVDITEILGLPIDPIPYAFGTAFLPHDHAFSLGLDAAAGRLSGRLRIDMEYILSNTRLDGYPTGIRLEIATFLQALQAGSGKARIRHDELEVEIRTSRYLCLSCLDPDPIPKAPEPSVALLLMIGLTGLSAQRHASTSVR